MRATLRIALLAAAWPLQAGALHARATDTSMQDMPGMAHAGHAQSTPGAKPSASTVHAASAHSERAGSPNGHVPPPPPTHPMPSMPADRMPVAMQMHDDAPMAMLLADRLERRFSARGGDADAWDAKAGWGAPIDRLMLETEGERDAHGLVDGRLEALWGHAVTSFLDTHLGMRHDLGGPSRQWLAAGVEGLAPYRFDVEATAYLGQGGRTALRIAATRDLLFTQRLILTPRVEANLYSRDDRKRGIRAGLSEVQAGLRLRYEFSRRCAPYLGVEWTHRRAPGSPTRDPEPGHDRVWLAGLRVWF